MITVFKRGAPALVLCSTLFMLAACHDPVSETSQDQGNADRNQGLMPGLPSNPGGLASLGSGINDRIFFKLDSSGITPEARTTLERIAVWAKANPQLRFTVEGHCDDRGTREYNLALGERRAAAARDAELALGIEANRLQTVSYGKERPAVIGENEAAWAQNRRAVFVIQ